MQWKPERDAKKRESTCSIQISSNAIKTLSLCNYTHSPAVSYIQSARNCGAKKKTRKEVFFELSTLSIYRARVERSLALLQSLSLAWQIDIGDRIKSFRVFFFHAFLISCTQQQKNIFSGIPQFVHVCLSCLFSEFIATSVLCNRIPLMQSQHKSIEEEEALAIFRLHSSRSDIQSQTLVIGQDTEIEFLFAVLDFLVSLSLLSVFYFSLRDHHFMHVFPRLLPSHPFVLSRCARSYMWMKMALAIHVMPCETLSCAIFLLLLFIA